LENKIKVGSLLSGGDIFGSVFENDLYDNHSLMVHPRAKGRVTYIAPNGNYNLTDKILSLELDGKNYDYTMV
jgi:V-type H+-transporting ATPase subunit A